MCHLHKSSHTEYLGLLMLPSPLHHDHWLLLGLAILLSFVFTAIFAPFVAPYDPYKRVDRPLLAPSRKYILQNGASGYFPIRVVQPPLDQQQLFMVENAPQLQRPAYVVYTETARDPETLELALKGLREVALQLDG